jgi:hypothetical protein
MKNKTKEFDCVEMMHNGAKKIYKDTKKMSLQAELTYWQEKAASSPVLKKIIERSKKDLKKGKSLTLKGMKKTTTTSREIKYSQRDLDEQGGYAAREKKSSYRTSR